MSDTAKFIDAEEQSIEAVIDGVTVFLTVSPGNKQYDDLVNGRPADPAMGIEAKAPVTIEPFA